MNDFKSSPAALAEYISNGNWVNARHLEKINELLLKVSAGEIKKLIINMPPRHGKSELISKIFPFWFLGKFPDKRIILTSYNEKFASRFGRSVKELIQVYGKEVFNIGINKNARSNNSFLIESHQGGMESVGAGGTITGLGADILIIDDPIKNNKEAFSVNKREDIWEWFKATVFTRLEPGGAVIIIMTRWHEDDICGRISGEFDDWEQLVLKAIADEEYDPLGRKPGEALWEERINLEKLEDIRKTSGQFWFRSLYQQDPVPAGGNIFLREDFRYFEDEPDAYSIVEDGKLYHYKKDSLFIVAAVDLAITQKSYSDYTVALVAGKTLDNKVLILDVFREKIKSGGHLNLFDRVRKKHNIRLLGIESNGFQSTIAKEAIDQGFIVKKLLANKDKISSSTLIATLMNNGKVYFRKKAHWLDEFEHELLSFPNGRHDDQVDAFSYLTEIYYFASTAAPVSRGKKTDISESFQSW